MRHTLLRLWQDERGTAATETALVLGVIAVGTLGIFVGYAERLTEHLAGAASALPAGEQATGIISEGRPG